MVNVGILVFPQVEELDFVGPLETFAAGRKVDPGCLSVNLVSLEQGPLEGANGLRFLPEVYAEGSEKMDVLILPGGPGRRAAMKDRKLLAFVAGQYEHVRYLGTVCTGSFIAAEAGLLSGKAATTHHLYLDELDSYEGVKVVRRKVVRDGRILTAGGVSSGIDLGLCLLALLFSEDLAKAAADHIEFPYRPKEFAEF